MEGQSDLAMELGISAEALVKPRFNSCKSPLLLFWVGWQSNDYGAIVALDTPVGYCAILYPTFSQDTVPNKPFD